MFNKQKRAKLKQIKAGLMKITEKSNLKYKKSQSNIKSKN